MCTNIANEMVNKLINYNQGLKGEKVCFILYYNLVLYFVYHNLVNLILQVGIF